MQSEIKFSIALPVYNGGEHLKSCINSILNQTYTGFKLLIFNSVNNSDGSTEYINSLKDERVQVIQASSVLNIEQNWARFKHEFDTEYATIIGQDDIYSPCFLEKINALILQYPDASLWHSHFNLIDQHGNEIRGSKPIAIRESPGTYLKSILNAEVDSVGTGYVFRSSDYIKVGGIPLYPSLLFADLALWINLTALSYKVNSPEQLYSFRKHESTTSLSSPVTYFNSFQLFLDFLIAAGNNRKEYNPILNNYLSAYIVFCAEIIGFKIIRAKKAVMLDDKKFTVKRMLNRLDQFVHHNKSSITVKKKYSFKTKMALFINSNSYLQKTYQIIKKIKK